LGKAPVHPSPMRVRPKSKHSTGSRSDPDSQPGTPITLPIPELTQAEVMEISKTLPYCVFKGDREREPDLRIYQRIMIKRGKDGVMPEDAPFVLRFPPKGAKEPRELIRYKAKVHMISDDLDVEGSNGRGTPPPDSSVGAIPVGIPTFGMFNPMLNNLFTQLKAPQFTGKAEDWQNFKKEWLKYLNLLKSSTPGGQLPDNVLLQALKSSLDTQTQRILVKREELDTSITYIQFWGELETEYETDLTNKHRAAWKSVKLDDPENLTFKNWRKFITEFEIRRNRIEDWTEIEEYQLIMQNLFSTWRKKIMEEEGKRKKQQCLDKNVWST